MSVNTILIAVRLHVPQCTTCKLIKCCLVRTCLTVIHKWGPEVDKTDRSWVKCCLKVAPAELYLRVFVVLLFYVQIHVFISTKNTNEWTREGAESRQKAGNERGVVSGPKRRTKRWGLTPTSFRNRTQYYVVVLWGGNLMYLMNSLLFFI